MAKRRQHEQKQTIICPKCGRHKRATNHHVLPRCFFGDTHPKIQLCWECHEFLHEHLYPPDRQEPDVYFRIMNRFLA